jgi:hypothetical protein
MSENDYQKLSEISASQWGLITTAQAEQVGISRVKLSRLTKSNQFIRLAHGVYRDAGAMESNNEAIKVAWLSTEPTLLADKRLQNPSIIVGGTTASYLWGCGDFDPFPYQFFVGYRKQTQRAELSYIKAAFSPEDYLLTDGLPVARIEFTMAGLIHAGYDVSLVAGVLKDARVGIGMEAAGGVRFEQDYFIKCLDRIARKTRYKSGETLYESLLVRIGESADDYKRLLEAVLGASQVSREMAQQAIGKILGGFPELNDAIQDAVASLMRSMDFAPVIKTVQANISINALETLEASLGEAFKRSAPKIDLKALSTLSNPPKRHEQEDAHE